MDQAGSSFDGVAFHCYAGTVGQIDDFHSKYPDKEIHNTECAGTLGSDWWSDIKWYIDNLFIGAIEHNSHTALMWNIAGNSDGGPKLPGTTSCGGSGCRPIATVYSGGTYALSQECMLFFSFTVAFFLSSNHNQFIQWPKRPKRSYQRTKADHGQRGLK